LYTAFELEKMGGGFINQKLLAQTADILGQVSAWFWGHEHNLVVFEKFQNVLGRCIGHGAFPIGKDEIGKVNPDIKRTNVSLALDKTGGLFQHGYIMMQLTGDRTAVTYFQFDPQTGQEKQIFSEAL
jgi:hypothetical protein